MDKKLSTFKRYILPGLIFQSVVISGGYGTGKELIEFFAPYGSLGGLLSMCVVTFSFWACVCAVTFEFARVFRTYNYKSLFTELLGRFWVLYEVCYIILLFMVLAVVAATAGANAVLVFGISKWYGIALMSLCIVLLVINGTQAIETFLSYWSYLLYAVYIIFLIACFLNFNDTISNQLLTVREINNGWPIGGAKYAFYNLGIIPAVLFATRDTESRKEAICAGFLAAAIAIMPAILLYIAMTGVYPLILTADVPVNAVFYELNMPLLQYVFQIVLFGTLIETGSGFIKAVIDRFEDSYIKNGIKPSEWLSISITVLCVSLGVILSTLGLTRLISVGYGAITWCFLIIYVIPILTFGVYKILRA